MKPEAVNQWSVKTLCGECGAVTRYHHLDHGTGRDIGA